MIIEIHISGPPLSIAAQAACFCVITLTANKILGRNSTTKSRLINIQQTRLQRHLQQTNHPGPTNCSITEREKRKRKSSEQAKRKC